MNYFVCVLYSKRFRRRYVGNSKNPNNRLHEHNSGKTKSTKAFRPWEVVYTERFASRWEARQREKFLKSGIGREFLDGILKMKLDPCLPAGRRSITHLRHPGGVTSAGERLITQTEFSLDTLLTYDRNGPVA